MTIDTIRPTLEPHTEQFIDGLASGPPIYSLSPDEARSVLVQAQSIPVGKPSAQIEDIAFPVGPTGSVPVRIVRRRPAIRSRSSRRTPPPATWSIIAQTCTSIRRD